MLPVKRSAMRSVFHDSRYGGYFIRLSNGDLIFVSDSDANMHNGNALEAAHRGRWTGVPTDIPMDDYFIRMATA